jgi:hypothetical protein
LGALRQTNGEYRVAPTETTTYTLTATSMDGTVATQTATVQVLGPPVGQVQQQQQQQQPQAARPSFLINVYHDHGANFGGNRMPMCWGQLTATGGHLIYRTSSTNDGRRDDFDVLVTQVQEVQTNRVPIRNQAAFHITVGGQHFNFIPVGIVPAQAVSMIQQGLQGR